MMRRHSDLSEIFRASARKDLDGLNGLQHKI
jgi:hypothetical protein